MVLGGEVSARGAFGGGELFPPDDTGEAAGLGPSALTLTFGFGRSLFRTDSGEDRFGLASALPEHFTELPVMVNDFIDPARSDGNLCIQPCAEDPQVAVHAIRNLSRIAVGRAALRWSQLGFGRTSSTRPAVHAAQPVRAEGRHEQPEGEQQDLVDEHVWISPGRQGRPGWAVGGQLPHCLLDLE